MSDTKENSINFNETQNEIKDNKWCGSCYVQTNHYIYCAAHIMEGKMTVRHKSGTLKCDCCKVIYTDQLACCEFPNCVTEALHGQYLSDSKDSYRGYGLICKKHINYYVQYCICAYECDCPRNGWYNNEDEWVCDLEDEDDN